VSTDEPNQQREEPEYGSEEGHADESVEPTVARKKLPAGWRPEHAGGKGPVHIFVEEPDPNAATSPFGDKRYETFRKQMAAAAVVIVLGAVTFSILFTFFPLFEDPEKKGAADASSSASATGLSAEQVREIQLNTLREQLQESVADRNWSAIEQLAGAVLKMEPADGEAWNYIALVNEKAGKPQEALDAYSKAIDAQFLPSFTLLRRAAIYRQLGNYQAAIADLQESARLDPQSIAVPNLILVYQIQAGDAERVRKAVEGFEAAGLESAGQQYLLGKAALALHDGDPAKAAAILSQYQALVPPQVLAELLQDPFFAPYRNEVALLPFYLNN